MLRKLPVSGSELYVLAARGLVTDPLVALGSGRAFYRGDPFPGSLVKSDTAVRIAVDNGHSITPLLAQNHSANEGLLVGPFGFLGKFSPISTAANRGAASTIKELAKYGGDANCGLYVLGGVAVENSPLYYSSTKGHTMATRVLLESGALPNKGWSVLKGFIASATPLYFAAKHGHTNTVKSLLEAGADIHVGLQVGPSGLLGVQSPLEVALSNKRHKAASLLREVGSAKLKSPQGPEL